MSYHSILSDREYMEHLINERSKLDLQVQNLKEQVEFLQTEREMSFIKRLLRLTATYDASDVLSWRFDDNDKLSFFINCSDVFYWATSDAEDVTPDNISILEKSFKDLENIDYDYAYAYGSTLFCARLRKMRPQGAAYPFSSFTIPECDPQDLETYQKVWNLFDAAGPEREVGTFNPRHPPYKTIEK